MSLVTTFLSKLLLLLITCLNIQLNDWHFPDHLWLKQPGQSADSLFCAFEEEISLHTYVVNARPQEIFCLKPFRQAFSQFLEAFPLHFYCYNYRTAPHMLHVVPYMYYKTRAYAKHGRPIIYEWSLKKRYIR